jgi:hypothetical protein
MLGFIKYPRLGRGAYQSATAAPDSRAEAIPTDADFDPIYGGGRDAIDHPELLRLYDYWNAKRRGRPMPTRQDIDPLELRPLLPHIALIEVEQNPRRYRYRLVGTQLVSILGQDVTGKYLDQMPPLFRRFATNAYAELMARKAPTYAVYDTHIPMFRAVRYKRLMLPLSPDGDRITMVVAGFFPY